MTSQDLCIRAQIAREDNTQACVFPRAPASCTAPSTDPMTGLEMTAEHHVSLGNGHHVFSKALKLMNTECFPASPKLKQGAIRLKQFWKVSVWCDQTNSVSGS